MRNSFLIGTAVVIVLASAGGYHFISKAPTIADTHIRKAFQTAGFGHVQIPAPEMELGNLHYSNMKLDPDGFSTIKTLDIAFQPINVLLSGKIASIAISGLNLTGEISNSGEISISGWNKALSNLIPSAYTIETVEIRDSKLSLLTPDLDGVTVDYDLQLFNRGLSNDMQGHFSSQQKNLSFESSASGHIDSDGSWQTTFEISEAKLNTENLKIMRASGNAIFSGMMGTPGFETTTALKAGGMSLYNMPWQNISSSLQGTPGNFKIYTTAQSVSHVNVDLILSTHNINGKAKTNGTLHAKDYDTLMRYLKEQTFFVLNDKMKNVLKDASRQDDPLGINLNFQIGSTH